MRNRCECRLTVIGSRRDVQLFRNSQWEKALRAAYTEPLELSPCRFVCQFETEQQNGHDLQRLQRLSRSHPRLVLSFGHTLDSGREDLVVQQQDQPWMRPG